MNKMEGRTDKPLCNGSVVTTQQVEDLGGIIRVGTKVEHTNLCIVSEARLCFYPLKQDLFQKMKDQLMLHLLSVY